ncbi:MAG: N-acetylglucosamine-6-phosphate deacetylase [Filifactoraceae bacterium]
MEKIFINGKMLIDNKIVEGKKLIFNKEIKEILDKDQPHRENLEVIDLNGSYLFAGFVDVHTHGVHGSDVMDATPKSLRDISDSLVSYGVTSFLATTMTMSKENIKSALENVKQCMNLNLLEGAKMVGVHLEGPFISKKYKGAQDENHITRPDWKMIEEHKDIIKIITLAVEEDKDYEFIKNNVGIKLSIGHTDASFEQALESYDLGVTHCTHCFNAMTSLHHRKPGVVGACFTKKYETEFIPDGVHIHSGFLETFINIIGKEQGIIITDSIRASGMEEGEYTLGGQKVIVDRIASRLEDGNLAGSILTMDKAIRNMREFTKLPLEDIIRMATENPAKSLGLEDRIGTIKEGKLADFVVMDENLEVMMTLVEGKIIYKNI